MRAAFEAGGEGSIEDWLVENLLKKLKVETSQSSIINATFSSSDPRFSLESPTRSPKPLSTRCSSCVWNRRGRRRRGTTNS